MVLHEPFDRSLHVEGQFERILAGFEGYGFSFERSGFGLKVRASFRTSTCNLPNQRSFIRCGRLRPPGLTSRPFLRVHRSLPLWAKEKRTSILEYISFNLLYLYDTKAKTRRRQTVVFSPIQGFSRLGLGARGWRSARRRGADCAGVVNGCNEQAAKLVGLLLYRIWYRIWRDFRSFPVCAEQRK